MLIHRSRLPESSFLPHGIEKGRLLQYGHAYQLSVCANVKAMDVRVCVLPVPRNSVKTEIFSLQNDRTTELNVNFLLTTTVHHPSIFV